MYRHKQCSFRLFLTLMLMWYFFRKLSKPKEEINPHERDLVSYRATYIFAYLFHQDTDFCDLEVFLTRKTYREIYIIFPFSVVKLGLFRFPQNWIHLHHWCQAIRPNAKGCVCPVLEGGCNTSPRPVSVKLATWVGHWYLVENAQTRTLRYNLNSTILQRKKF